MLWGTNEKDEKVLIAVELVELENQVKVHTFPEEVATEEFYNQMMNQWREGQPVPFPEGHAEMDRPLSMSESILPDELKTTNTDILNRAKSEWHFVVLSAKLYSAYMDELEEIKERVEQLVNYDGGIWEEMKSFWGKVQSQSREKNLFKEHAQDLREKTNDIFGRLKNLRRSMNEEFEKVSKDHLEEFFNKLGDIESRIERGLGLQPIFNELKNLQKTFRETEFTRKHRSDVWKRLDAAFKLVKAKKYGKTQGDGSALSRINRRYEGLLAAIKKMEVSIKRDKSERDFQKKRIDTTDGQLELQIRQAKLTMIEERIQSKENKLEEMLKTKGELERKIETEKQKEEKNKKQSPDRGPEDEGQKQAPGADAEQVDAEKETDQSTEDAESPGTDQGNEDQGEPEPSEMPEEAGKGEEE